MAGDGIQEHLYCNEVLGPEVKPLTTSEEISINRNINTCREDADCSPTRSGSNLLSHSEIGQIGDYNDGPISASAVV
jgi:hypothetical protein